MQRGPRQRAAGGEPDVDSILKALLPFSRRIDAINTWIGKRLSWLILAAVIVSAVNASVRKIFDTSSNSWLELQWVLFSIVFLLCSPWTLLANEHIRIDIVNNLLPKWLRNTIDVVGHAFFLLPLTIVMMITGIPFFLRSYRHQRAVGQCRRPAAMAGEVADHDRLCLLFVQGISELIKRIAIMRGLIPDPHETAGPRARSRSRAHRRSDRKTLSVRSGGWGLR